MNPENQQQVPAVYHRRIGDIVVTALSDGYLDTPLASFTSITEEEAAARLRQRFQPAPPRVSINAFVIRSGGRTAIVDTGAGDTMGKTLGLLPQSLNAMQVSRSDIDTVLLTHLHPDHSNGLAGNDGTALFPKAELVVSEADMRFRHDNSIRSRFTEIQQRRYFNDPRFQVAPYADRTKHAQGEVFPGVTAVPLPGHTPGHTGYLISSGNESLLIWGDVCHAQELQLADPGISVTFDVDNDAAIATRRRILDQVASDKLLVAGMHVHFPGFIHVVRNGNGYAAEPESWRHEMV